MARPPSGKVRQRTEWWDFAGERMSGVWQLPFFRCSSSCYCRDVDVVKKDEVGMVEGALLGDWTRPCAPPGWLNLGQFFWLGTQ